VRKRHNHSSIRDSQCVPFKCAAKSGRRAAGHANIIPDVSYIKAKKKSNHFNNAGDGIELKLFRIKRVGVNQALKNIKLSVAKLESLQAQRQEYVQLKTSFIIPLHYFLNQVLQPSSILIPENVSH